MNPLLHILAVVVQVPIEARGIPSFGELLTHWQMPLVIGLSSGLVYLTAKVSPRAAALGDWTKRLALLVVAMVVSVGVRSVGGEVSVDLAGLFWTAADGLASAVTGSAVFRMGKTQPGNGDG